MLVRRTLTTFAIAAAIGMAAPAAAQVNAANPASVAEAMRAAGYGAEQQRDDDGRPMITGTLNELRFVVLFYGCNEAGSACETIQFRIRFVDPQADLARINEWNRTRRFGRAYIDTDGDAVLEMDINISRGGASPALFADNLEYWRELVVVFGGHIYPS
jgi:hypothetical protein